MKLDRLLAITMLLLSRSRVGARELAERFEVLRTIYRDLETLNQAGIPIVSYTGTAGGYEIMESYRIDRQWLSYDELEALASILKSVRSTQMIEERNIDRLLEKVFALVSRSEQNRLAEADHSFIIDIHPWKSAEAERRKFALLREALRGCRLVRFDYTDAQGTVTERVVEPMGLALKASWYLYAFCRGRSDYRMFRLTRLKHPELLPDTYVRRAVTLQELDRRWDRRPEMKMVTLVLHFPQTAKVRVADRFEEEQIEVQPDGSLIVRVVYPEDEGLIDFLLGFGTDARLIAPVHVAEALREKAQAVANLYKC